MPDIHISIVSHGHEQQIKESNLLEKLAPLHIILRENKFSHWNDKPAHVDLDFNSTPLGYGSNHNLNFNLISIPDEDWFVICNPDIDMTSSQVMKIIEIADKERLECLSIPLYSKSGEFDRNFRKWPSIISLFFSYFAKKPVHYIMSDGQSDILEVDWISGALLFIKAGVFMKINGFDERYFMYMEDVDLCKKLESANIKRAIIKFDNIIHDAARDNRRLFSLPMAWHVSSIIKYFIKWRIT